MQRLAILTLLLMASWAKEGDVIGSGRKTEGGEQQATQVIPNSQESRLAISIYFLSYGWLP